MKRIIQKLKGDDGAALITALLFLVMLTLLGVTAIWTASTETSLGGNERLNKQAFYLADAGLQEAMARLDFNDAANPTYYIDTNKNTIVPSGSPWSLSAGLGAGWSGAGKVFYRNDGFANYTVYIKPSFEDNFHNYSAAPLDQLVLYNKGFKYSDSPIDASNNATGGFPVFHIVSVGRVRGPSGVLLATATVQADVTKNTINLNTPGAVYSGACINFLGNSFNIVAPGDVAVSTPSANNCQSPTLTSYSGTANVSGHLAPSAPLLNMSSFLGVGLSQLKSMATISYTGGSTETGVNWGSYASETNAQVVYVDNACKYTASPPCTNGSFHISGGQGFGILVVTGDLDITGGFEYKGLVYVMGDLSITGTGNHVEGSVMVKGATTTNIGGNATLTLNRDMLAKVSKASFTSKIISWKEIRN